MLFAKLVIEGVVGVGGKESEERVGDERLAALDNGRNMPDLGMVVVKYRVLQPCQQCIEN